MSTKEKFWVILDQTVRVNQQPFVPCSELSKRAAVPQRFLVKMFGTMLLKSIKILLMFLVRCISGQTFQDAKLSTCSCICTPGLMHQDLMTYTKTVSLLQRKKRVLIQKVTVKK